MCITNRRPSLIGLNNLQQLSPAGATSLTDTGAGMMGTSTQALPPSLDTLLRSDLAEVATLLERQRLAQRAAAEDEARQRLAMEQRHLRHREDDPSVHLTSTVPQKMMMPKGSNFVFMTHHDYGVIPSMKAAAAVKTQPPQELHQQEVPQPQPILSQLQPEPIPSGLPRCRPEEAASTTTIPDVTKTLAKKNRALPQQPQPPRSSPRTEYPVTKKLQPGFTAKHHTRHYVQHNYHDHSLDAPEGWEEKEIVLAAAGKAEGDSSTSSGCTGAGPKGSVPVPFPIRLHEMLDKIEDDGYAHVISWQPHGRAFVVHDVKRFVSTIMPTYFRQTKITSFQRQLNLYGFSRITRGRDRGGYYHELFLRGRRFLCNRMVRTKVKGTRIKAVSSPESEPNFYAMPPIGSAPPMSRQTMAPPEDAPPVAPAPMKPARNPVAVPEMVVSSKPPQQQRECQNLSVPLRDESSEDLLLDFEGMHFHYLDPILKRSVIRDQQANAAAPAKPLSAPLPEPRAVSEAASSARSSISRQPINFDKGEELEPVTVEAPSELDDVAMDEFFSTFDVSPLDEELDHVDNDVDLGFLLEKIVD